MVGRWRTNGTGRNNQTDNNNTAFLLSFLQKKLSVEFPHGNPTCVFFKGLYSCVNTHYQINHAQTCISWLLLCDCDRESQSGDLPCPFQSVSSCVPALDHFGKIEKHDWERPHPTCVNETWQLLNCTASLKSINCVSFK